ncbi:MAG: helix-turn-helix domain-containing protein [Candidatus Hermodarchaeota archaeon]
MEIISKQLKEIEDINESILEEKGIFKSKRLFKCILGLNELESNVLSYLLKNENVSTLELTKIFPKDRSSIQRVLQNLIELNLIERHSMSLKNYTETKELRSKKLRGYLYVYSARNIDSIKEQFKMLLDKWYESMIDYIENLDSLFDCFESNGELC